MMLALEMYRSLPRHLAGKAIGGRMPGMLSGYAAPLRLVTIDEPRGRPAGLGAAAHPALRRLRVRPRRAVRAHQPLLLRRWCRCRSCPATRSWPTCSTTARTCRPAPAWSIDPVLTCAARGVEPCDACARGATNRCSRITVGHLAPGLQTGFCADTGGGWGEVLTAHRSQLHAGARGLLRRAGDPDRADGLRGAHRAAGRRRGQRPGAGRAAPARSACSRRWPCAA